jgi:hypothetical protein
MRCEFNSDNSDNGDVSLDEQVVPNKRYILIFEIDVV